MSSFLSKPLLLIKAALLVAVLLLKNQQYGVGAFQITLPLATTEPTSSLTRPAKSGALYSTKIDSNISIRPCGEDGTSIAEVSRFMLESFWIPLSEQEEQQSSNANTKALLQSINEEFTTRYGEIMGRRTLKSCLLSAYDNSNEEEKLVGIVGIDMTLVDTENQKQYSRNEAESTIKNAVSSLGPKQRREYKDSTVAEIVNDLLPPNLSVGVVLSNLAVDPSQRKRGIGFELCTFVEEFVAGGDEEEGSRDSWCVSNIYLRVEEDNVPAKNLYENKMGYEVAWVEDGAVALRANLDAGEFQEIEKTTLSLRKTLN